MSVPNRSIVRHADAPRQPQMNRLNRLSNSQLASAPMLQVRGAVALAPLPAAYRQRPIESNLEATPPAPARSPSIATISGRKQVYPRGLRLLVLAQRGSFIGAAVVTAAALTLYGWTVYSQQQWSRQYSRFKMLQLHEQRLVTATGALEAQVLQSSDNTDSTLQPILPGDVVELAPAPLRPAAPSPPPPVSQTWTAPQPIGY